MRIRLATTVAVIALCVSVAPSFAFQVQHIHGTGFSRASLKQMCARLGGTYADAPNEYACLGAGVNGNSNTTCKPKDGGGQSCDIVTTTPNTPK